MDNNFLISSSFIYWGIPVKYNCLFSDFKYDKFPYLFIERFFPQKKFTKNPFGLLKYNLTSPKIIGDNYNNLYKHSLFSSLIKAYSFVIPNWKIQIGNLSIFGNKDFNRVLKNS